MIPILKLCRVEYLAFGYISLLAAFAQCGRALPASILAALLVMNVLFVAWTFAHNDLCDLEVDRRTPALDDRVLVRGDLSPRAARIVIGVLLVSMLLVASMALPFRALAFVLVASLLAIVYDHVSKHVLGSDLLFGVSAASLCLVGALAVAPFEEVTLVAWIVVAIVFVEHLFFNAIEGGLKDVPNDKAAGAITLAQRFVATDGESMVIGRPFVALGLLLKSTTVGLAAFALSRDPDTSRSQWIALAFFGGSALVFSFRLLSHRRYDWPKMAQDLMPIEMASRLIVPIVIASRIGWGGVALFFFVPAFWYLTLAKVVHSRGLALPKRF